MANVVLNGISKAFGHAEALKDIDLDIASGAFVVFVGPSGCGKSTLLRIIAGLEDPSCGDVLFDGARMNEVEPARREIAMVFQSYALYPHMNVYENMAFSLKLRKESKERIDAGVTAAARMLDIEPLLTRKPRELSGGQRQRVAIGRAIVRKPKVFLFDEPLSNLDADLRTRMRYELVRLHQTLKATMIYVTHDQVEAMTLADQIVVLSNGRIEQVGAPLELYRSPTNLFVAGFIGSPKINLLPGRLLEVSADSATVELAAGARVEVAADASRARAGDAVTVGIRPEDVVITAAPSSVSIECTIDFVERLGGVAFAYAGLPSAAGAMTMRIPEGASLKRGDRPWLSAPAQVCHLFDAKGDAFSRRR